MALTLTYNYESTLPVEIEGFTPTWARDKSLPEIAAFQVQHGNRKMPLGELFTPEGSAEDLILEIQGDLSGVHWIGAGISEGTIHIHGNAGRHLGSQMSGGAIYVHGNTGDWTGAAMQEGLIHVHGDAGDQVGAAYRGAPRGMTGGTILIDGDAGDEIGLAMRRGMICIGGNAGHMLAMNMLAGTVLVFGECGKHPGAGMNRGTLGLFSKHRPELLSTFRYACTTRLQVLPLLLKKLSEQGFAFDKTLGSIDYDIYNGDFVSLGRGEVFMRS